MPGWAIKPVNQASKHKLELTTLAIRKVGVEKTITNKSVPETPPLYPTSIQSVWKFPHPGWKLKYRMCGYVEISYFPRLPEVTTPGVDNKFLEYVILQVLSEQGFSYMF